MRKTIPIFMALAMSLTLAGSANADVLSFDLTSDHCTGGCLNGTVGGTVTVTEGIDSLIFDVTLANGFTFINAGFDATFGFNLDGSPSITYSGLTLGAPKTLTWSIPGGTGATQNAGSLHMDGMGYFDYGVLWNKQGGGHGFTGPLTFTVTSPGLTLASLDVNANNQWFGVDVYSGLTGKTGGIDASFIPPPPPPPPPPVPDGGATLILLGGALVGIAALRRRFNA